jgi:hypothetical protein
MHPITLPTSRWGLDDLVFACLILKFPSQRVNHDSEQAHVRTGVLENLKSFSQNPARRVYGEEEAPSEPLAQRGSDGASPSPKSEPADLILR